MQAASQEARLEQPRNLIRRDRAIADAAGRGLDLDERLEPKEAARTSAHNRNIDAAAARLIENRAGDGVRANRQRRRIGRERKRARSLRLPLRAGDDRVEAVAVETADRFAVESAAGERAQLPRQ